MDCKLFLIPESRYTLTGETEQIEQTE